MLGSSWELITLFAVFGGRSMNMNRAAVGLAVCMLTSCATFKTAFAPRPQQPVTITLVGALISPGKADGRSWDLDLPIPAGLQRTMEQIAENAAKHALTGALETHFALPPEFSLEVSNAVVNFVAEGIREDAAPDPFGTATVSTTQDSVVNRLPKHDNTYLPEWGPHGAV